MSQFVKYTDHNDGGTGYVNMSLIAQIMKYPADTSIGQSAHTRLFTGHVAMAANEMASGTEYFYISARESPEYFIDIIGNAGEMKSATPSAKARDAG